MVPVLKGPFQANAIADYLKRKLEPFYSEGKGRIVCPVCTVFASRDEYRIVYYSRTEFKAHYEKRHQHFEGTAYQGFGTGYNTRMYEATQIYTLASWLTSAAPAPSKTEGALITKCTIQGT
jgi:hypothetical protein